MGKLPHAATQKGEREMISSQLQPQKWDIQREETVVDLGQTAKDYHRVKRVEGLFGFF